MKTASEFTLENCAARQLDVYERLLEEGPATKEGAVAAWQTAVDQIRMEWKLISRLTDAVASTLQPNDTSETQESS